MMYLRHVFGTAVVLCLLFLAACAPQEKPPAEEKVPPVAKEEPAPIVEEEEEVRETKNVTYQGVVEVAGISIYQEGSHRLTLEDEKFILLESDDVDLNGYVGERVEVLGALRPTVEAGGMIMRVENITLLEEEVEEEEAPAEDEEEPEAMEDEKEPEMMEEELKEEPETMEEEVMAETGALMEEPSFAPDGATEGKEEEPEVMEEEEVMAETGALMEEEEAEVMEEEKDEEAMLEEEPAPTVSADVQKRIDAMAKADIAAGNWTQQYCTAHIGFCIPIHRNWWYKSFGTTTTYLWHVELSSEVLESLGSGPIVINLISGSLDSVGASEGVTTEGNFAVGYRSWTDNRHFEITGDMSLKASVEYITENLVPYELGD